MSENIDNTLTAYLGPEFQQRLMWQILVEPEFAEKTIPNLAIDYFDDPNLKRLFIIILEYVKEFEKVPNLQNQSIHQAIAKYKTPNNRIEEESLAAVIERIKLWNERTINKQISYDGDAVQKSTTAFIKQQEYRKLAETIITFTKNGGIREKQNIAVIEERFQKIAHIGDEEDYGTDVFDNIEHALRKEFRKTIPTGVGVIDSLTGGGLGKGEIGVILTPSGVGKTTLLTKIANTAYDDQKNIAQIIFEDTKEQIQRKHFAIWANSALSKMDEKDENTRVKKIAYEKCEAMRGKGNLVIKKFSQENTTMMDIRNWMTNYQKKFGIKFDILVLDYLDCLESHKRVPDRNEAELQIIKSFEALAGDFDIPAWTAIQSNRSGFGAEFIEAHQTGGNIKRIQKAHFFMSVAKTPAQQEANFANIRILKARFAKDGQSFEDCIFNNDTLQIIIEDKRYPVKTTLKHHDDDDVNKIDETARELQRKSSDIDMHVAVNRHTEGSLMERLLDENINDTIPINTTFDSSPSTNDGVNDAVNDGVNEGVKNDELLDIEDEPIITVETNIEIGEGAIGGAIEGAKAPIIDDVTGWTGQSFNTVTNETEVKLEDIQPQIVVPEIKNEPKIEEKQLTVHEKIIMNKEKQQQITNTFDDPDAPSSEHAGVYEMLEKKAKHQEIIKKE